MKSRLWNEAKYTPYVPVLMMVQEAPSLIISLLVSDGHGVAWNWIILS